MGGEGGGGLLPLRLPSACLTACLAYRSETQTPAGCRPEEGWIITQNSVSLCPALCLQGPPDRCDHDSFLIPPAEKNSIFGNQRSKLVTAKSNIHCLPGSACLLDILNS